MDLTRTGMLVLMVLFLTVDLGFGQNTTKQFMIKGVEYGAQGNFQDAKEEFEKVLKINPSNTVAEEGLKVIEYVNEEKVRSEAAIHFYKGIAYYFKRHPDEAIAEFNKAIEKSPKFALAYNNLGKVHRWKGQYKQAIFDHGKAIEINSRYIEAYLSRGITYGKKGQHNKAISDFTKAIEINPRYAVAYNFRGSAYNETGEFDKAISDFTKAIEINPRLTEAYNVRGIAYDETEEFDKAIADFTKAIRN